MTLQISGTYIALLSLYAMVLGAMVSIHRAKTGVSIFHGDDITLAEKIRRHGNFTETVPLALLLMVVAEAQGAGPSWLHAAGLLLLVSRLVHPFGLKHDNPNNVLRGIGSGGTTLAMLLMIVFILWNALAG